MHDLVFILGKCDKKQFNELSISDLNNRKIFGLTNFFLKVLRYFVVSIVIAHICADAERNKIPCQTRLSMRE